MPTLSTQAQGQAKRTPKPVVSLSGNVRRANAQYDYQQALADLNIAETRTREDYQILQGQRGREQKQEAKLFGADYTNRGLAESGAYQQDLSTLMAAQAAQLAEDSRQYRYSLEDIGRGRLKAGSLFEKESSIATMEDVDAGQRQAAEQDFYSSLMAQRGVPYDPVLANTISTVTNRMKSTMGSLFGKKKSSPTSADSIYNNRRR